MQNKVEIRCPNPNLFNKLFLVLLKEHMPENDMYMEIACSDCAKWARANGGPGVFRVLHYYDTDGNCVNTKAVTKEYYSTADDTKR